MEFAIDRQGPLPLQEQLKEQIRLLVDVGRLRPGDGLPTIKEAARRLGLNANTVAAVYRNLEEEGYLEQRKRAGTSIAVEPPISSERVLAAQFALEAGRRARHAGLEPGDLVRAVAAQALLDAELRPLRVAALAETADRAAALAKRSEAVLGENFECVPVTPGEYVSIDYHLTLIDPELSARLERNRGPVLETWSQPQLNYSPEFPAGAD